MKQKYCINKKYRSKFEQLWNIVDKYSIQPIPDSSLLIYSVDIKGENLTNAEKLHKLRDRISSSDIRVKRISDDSHIYLCNKLFPIIASIEDVLKDIVYITYSVANKQIDRNFDGKFLYDYFSLLIHDVKFNESVASLFLNNKRYSKHQLIKLINEIDENPIYQEVELDVSDAKIIDKFDKVNSWRNKVMHFKPFTYDDYLDASVFLPVYLDNLRTLYTKLTSKTTPLGLAAIMNKNAIAIGETINEVMKNMQPSYLAFQTMAEAIKPRLTLSDDTYDSIQKSLMAVSSIWSNLNFGPNEEDENDNDDSNDYVDNDE